MSDKEKQSLADRWESFTRCKGVDDYGRYLMFTAIFFAIAVGVIAAWSWIIVHPLAIGGITAGVLFLVGAFMVISEI